MRQASPSSNRDMVLDKRAYYLTEEGKAKVTVLLAAMSKEYIRTGVNRFSRAEISRLSGYGRTMTVIYLKKAWALGLVEPVSDRDFILTDKYLRSVIKYANK